MRHAPLLSLVLLTGCFEAEDPSAETESSSGAMSTSSTGGAGSVGGPDGSTGPGAGTQADSTGGPADTGGSSGGPGPVCPSSHECVPIAVEGWEGPIARNDAFDNGEAGLCGGAYPDDVGEYVFDFTSMEAVCECECGDPSGVSCTYQAAHYTTGGCGGTQTTIGVPFLNTCVNIADTTHDDWRVIATPSGGSCTPIETVQIPPVVYHSQMRLCAGAEPIPGCAADEQCLPRPVSPFVSELCIFQEGEHECPAGPYSEQIIRHTSHEDTRACGPACTCEDPEGDCTGAQVNLYRYTDTCTTGGVCTVPPCSATIGAACSATGMPEVRSLRRTSGATFAGTCDGSVFDEVGTLEPTGPVTLCCTP